MIREEVADMSAKPDVDSYVHHCRGWYIVAHWSNYLSCWMGYVRDDIQELTGRRDVYGTLEDIVAYVNIYRRRSDAVRKARQLYCRNRA
jgi:hypothetical protein